MVTPFCEARLHPEGGLASLTERPTGQPWLKPGQRSGFFAGTIDGEDRESKGQWLLPAAPDDAPAVTAREDGAIGAIPYTFELTFHAETPRLDCRARFHFAGQKLGCVSTDQRDGASGFVHEQKLRFKLFPAPGAGTLDAEVRLFDAGSENVLLSALYPEGGRILARLHEYQGRAGEATMAAANGTARLVEVDLLGGNARLVANPLTFRPWQIRTVRIESVR